MYRRGGPQRLLAAGTLSVLLLGATACSNSSGESAGTESASSGVSTAGATPPSKASAKLPAGYRWRTVEKVHTTFAAPDSWTALDAAELSDATADSPQIKELAERAGFTAQQALQFLAKVDLYLAGPPIGGYAPNIQAVVTPALDELPSDAAINAEIGRVASSKPTLRHVGTPAGEALDVAYRIEVSNKTIYARSLLLDTGDGVLNLTVAAPDQAMVSKIAENLLSTAHIA